MQLSPYACGGGETEKCVDLLSLGALSYKYKANKYSIQNVTFPTQHLFISRLFQDLKINLTEILNYT